MTKADPLTRMLAAAANVDASCIQTGIALLRKLYVNSDDVKTNQKGIGEFN